MTDRQRTVLTEPYYGPDGETVEPSTSASPSESLGPVMLPGGYSISENGAVILPSADIVERPITTMDMDPRLEGISPNIHEGQQGKHILGHNNYQPGRSVISDDVDTQELLDNALAGQYDVAGVGSRGQPIVDFGEIIGTDATTGLATQYGTIHSGNNGSHIVPTNPTTINR